MTNVVPATGLHLFCKHFQGEVQLIFIHYARCLAKDDGRTVIHRMVKCRSRKHKSIQVGNAQTNV